MADRARPERRRPGPLSAIRLRAALALGTVLCIGATGTYAYWSDSVPVEGVTISSGTLDLKINGNDSMTNYTALSLANMVPGNTTAGVMTVRNAGTVPLDYFADAAAGGALGSALAVKVTGDSSVTGSGSSRTCAGSALGNTGSSFGNNLVGSRTNPRRLQAGASETVCVQATLPANAASSLQGASTNVSFAFSANQVT
jgi:predicted ribosomally synthesized peptide with SipW-like signal peptide